jgi:methylthioribose-1-phosphate isomerase
MTISSQVNPIIWQDDLVYLVDQTLLPNQFTLKPIKSASEMAQAIKTMVVRGAPAIGVSAAYGIYLGARDIAIENRELFLQELGSIAEMLGETRPTAVNLFWAIERVMKVANETAGDVETIKRRLLQEAQTIHQEDLETCLAIGKEGLAILPQTKKKLTILTHCNAGALATAGYGTALGVIRAAWSAGRLDRVIADETRPRLQGAKLTTWECAQEGIPVTLISDNMSAHCMKLGMIDAVVVGADRIAANGDTANKIGTYGLAVISKMHNVPFYVAAPLSTIDFSLATGEQIPIEQRHSSEISHVGETLICPSTGVDFYNPAFDVTSCELITAIITEKGSFKPSELLTLRR